METKKIFEFDALRRTIQQLETFAKAREAGLLRFNQYPIFKKPNLQNATYFDLLQGEAGTNPGKYLYAAILEMSPAIFALAIKEAKEELSALGPDVVNETLTILYDARYCPEVKP